MAQAAGLAGCAGGAAAATTAAKERPGPGVEGAGEPGAGGARARAAASACASLEWAPGASGRKAASFATRTVELLCSVERSGRVSTLTPIATSAVAHRVPNEVDASKSACTLEAATDPGAAPSSLASASRLPQSA